MGSVSESVSVELGDGQLLFASTKLVTGYYVQELIDSHVE